MMNTTALASLVINDPQTHASLVESFELYEDALVHNKVDVLDELFWNSVHTLRYGVGENLNGYDEIKAFRASRPSAGLNRTILDKHIVTFGDGMGVANITFQRENSNRTGRQSQTWVRFDEGWRVVSAHVSLMGI